MSCPVENRSFSPAALHQHTRISFYAPRWPVPCNASGIHNDAISGTIWHPSICMLCPWITCIYLVEVQVILRCGNLPLLSMVKGPKSLQSRILCNFSLEHRHPRLYSWPPNLRYWLYSKTRATNLLSKNTNSLHFFQTESFYSSSQPID